MKYVTSNIGWDRITSNKDTLLIIERTHVSHQVSPLLHSFIIISEQPFALALRIYSVKICTDDVLKQV